MIVAYGRTEPVPHRVAGRPTLRLNLARHPSRADEMGTKTGGCTPIGVMGRLVTVACPLRRTMELWINGAVDLPMELRNCAVVTTSFVMIS